MNQTSGREIGRLYEGEKFFSVSWSFRGFCGEPTIHSCFEKFLCWAIKPMCQNSQQNFCFSVGLFRHEMPARLIKLRSLSGSFQPELGGSLRRLNLDHESRIFSNTNGFPNYTEAPTNTFSIWIFHERSNIEVVTSVVWTRALCSSSRSKRSSRIFTKLEWQSAHRAARAKLKLASLSRQGEREAEFTWLQNPFHFFFPTFKLRAGEK